ncbi:MAG TPA: hypothetical protein VER33_18100 [Polyangiaceae bacterium]|nr:hypothetical protein [Polyangiaceae bacterium]
MQLSKFISPIVASVVVSAFAAACGTSDCEGEDCFGTGGGQAGQSGSSGRGGQNTGGRGGAGAAGSSAEGGASGEAGAAGGGASAGASGASGAGAGGAATGGAGAAGEGGSGGEGGSVIACDETRSPLEEACRLTDEAAIFVSPLGGAAGDGTREAPLASLTEAVALAAESGRFVAACTGTFQENLAVEGDLAVELYGGFDCDNGWAAGAPATIVAPNQGLPLSLTDVTERVHIEAFEFRAADATARGESSIAAKVVNSSDVTLRGLTLVAGNGADGVDGKTIGFTLPAASELRGNNAVGLSGAPFCRAQCISGVSRSGAGGDGEDVAVPAPAEPGGNGTPEYGGGKGGQVGLACASGGGGGDGAPAPAPLSGAGAESRGLLNEMGWAPRAGLEGAVGTPGQGGGGGRGAGSLSGAIPGGGGGGGCGGCGGKGGAPGQGGGGSIALLVVNSGLLLEESQLTTAEAGRGGAGAAGQLGQGGGGAGARFGDGCDGGRGGSGATGGHGAGGAGGISVGVLFTGPRAVTIATDVTHTSGLAGAGGLGAATPAGTNDGIAGVAQRVLEL